MIHGRSGASTERAKRAGFWLVEINTHRFLEQPKLAIGLSILCYGASPMCHHELMVTQNAALRNRIVARMTRVKASKDLLLVVRRACERTEISTGRRDGRTRVAAHGRGRR